jgi:serine/threonine protein kinase
MGIVYLARQTALNRTVALKLVHPGVNPDQKDLVRFLAEAEAVAAIRHPHVVQVHDVGSHASRPYLVLEYLPGGSLADRLRRDGRVGPKDAAGLVAKLAGAVQAAHEAGIIHRDLKPANVLFDAAGEPRVTDFGVAKRGAGGDLTRTQAIIGTPAYMPPEQAGGGAKFVGPAADVWALGVILYELLTGSRPFEADDAMSLLRKVAEEDPVSPRRRVADIPRDAELICMKCLAKDTAGRYSSARALSDDLGRFVAGESVSVRAPGVVERAAKWAQRKPTVAAAYGLTLLAVVLTAVSAGAVWLWQDAVANEKWRPKPRPGPTPTPRKPRTCGYRR